MMQVHCGMIALAAVLMLGDGWMSTFGRDDEFLLSMRLQINSKIWDQNHSASRRTGGIGVSSDARTNLLTLQNNIMYCTYMYSTVSRVCCFTRQNAERQASSTPMSDCPLGHPLYLHVYFRAYWYACLPGVPGGIECCIGLGTHNPHIIIIQTYRQLFMPVFSVNMPLCLG